MILANGMDLRALNLSNVLYDLRAALRVADPEPAAEFMNSWTRRDGASNTAFLVAASALHAAMAAVTHQQEQQEQQQQQQLRSAQTDQQHLIVQLHNQVACALALAEQLKERSN